MSQVLALRIPKITAYAPNCMRPGSAFWQKGHHMGDLPCAVSPCCWCSPNSRHRHLHFPCRALGPRMCWANTGVYNQIRKVYGSCVQLLCQLCQTQSTVPLQHSPSLWHTNVKSNRTAGHQPSTPTWPDLDSQGIWLPGPAELQLSAGGKWFEQSDS